MGLKRILAWLALLLGLLGIGASVGAAYAVWSLHASLDQANQKAFTTMHTSLIALRDRVLQAQQRVVQAKVTTEEVGQRLRSEVQRKAAETALLRLEIGATADKLTLWMQQADQW